MKLHSFSREREQSPRCLPAHPLILLGDIQVQFSGDSHDSLSLGASSNSMQRAVRLYKDVSEGNKRLMSKAGFNEASAVSSILH